LDALLVNRHYVGTYLFGDALKTQAADVDLSEKINPADALAINRRYVGLINRFRAPDWIFEIPEISVGGNDINLDIKSICSGDVDGTYTW
jgi:hypothetical protein